MPVSLASTQDNFEYWEKFIGIKQKYLSSLQKFIVELEANGEYETSYNARIIIALLQSTPDSHNIPRKIELLFAIEARIESWAKGPLFVT